MTDTQDQIDAGRANRPRKPTTEGIRRLISVHLPFWRRIELEELCPETDPGKALQGRIDDATFAIAALTDPALDEFIAEGKAAVIGVQESVSQTRNRAAQLLAATGFITLLASLGASSPATTAGTALMISFGLIAIYALIGTMYLTVNALAVRSWEQVRLRVSRETSARTMKEMYAVDLYIVHVKTRIRLTRPVGYLRDAYWFFFWTITTLVVIVVLRFLPFVTAALPVVPVPHG